MRIAIFTDEIGWHTARLQRALRERGCLGRCVDLAECRFDTSFAWHGLVIPGFGRELPDAAIVRGIAGGSFEQVTVRLGVLHALRKLGVPVYNDARAIERSVDKSMTSFLLHLGGIPTPAAWTTEDAASARRIALREAALRRAVVQKPLFGSQGEGLARAGAVGERFVAPRDLAQYGGLAYLQRFEPATSRAGSGSFDWRVLVIGGRAVTAMRRSNDHWIHNVAQGARCAAAPLKSSMLEIASIAEQAAVALGLDYAGVDLLPTSDGSTPATVIEVNGVAAWRGLQSVTGFDISQKLVDDLLTRKLGVLARNLAQASRKRAA